MKFTSALWLGIFLLIGLAPQALTAGDETSPGLRHEAIERREKGIVDRYVKELSLSEAAQKDMRELSELYPHGIAPALHGVAQKDSKGEWTIVPDTASARGVLQQFGLDDGSIGLFAVVAAAQDNIIQWEHEWDHPVWLIEDTAEGRRRQKEALEKKKTKYKTLLEAEAAIAANAYRALKNRVDEKKLSSIRAWLVSQSVEKEKANTIVMSAARKRAIARCQQGLQNCSFPEGVADNCAGYLGMTVKDLKARCPVIKRLDEK
jgi:hypothetical protein